MFRAYKNESFFVYDYDTDTMNDYIKWTWNSSK